MISTYYLYLNCWTFPKKPNKLEMKEKMSRGKTRTENLILTHEGRNARGTRKGTKIREVREHVK